MTNRHVAGARIASSHTTVIPEAEKLILALLKYSAIKKIVPSIIKSGLRSSSIQKRIKLFLLQNGAFKVVVRAGYSAQEIIVAGEDPDALCKILVDTAEEQDFKITTGGEPKGNG